MRTLHDIALMGKFHELEEFERRFDSMDSAELQRWRAYWTKYAQQFVRNARKLAMNRVYGIEKAIAEKGGAEPSASAIAIP